jgi:hypothetical protein
MNYAIDPGQKPYQQICERLGLPCYGTKEQFDIMTNKDIFKRYCADYGLDTPQEYHCCLESWGFASPDMTFPVVVKPVDGRASKGMTICGDESELPKAINYALSYSTRGKVLIEQFVDGQEVVIKYFVIDGEIYLTSMADLFTAYKPDGSRAYIGMQVFPSQYYDLFRQTADARVREMIRGIGITNGPLSFDGIVNDGKFYFFDQSFRMGGAQDWRIVTAITGVDISSLLTHYALYGTMGCNGGVDKLDGGFADKAACMEYFLVREGTIGKIGGLPEVTGRKSVIGYHLSHEEGDVVKYTGTSDHVVMRLLLVCDDQDALRREMDTIRDLITITDTNGEDMLLPNLK